MLHTIDECKALQDKIEELIRAGHFRRFVKKMDHPTQDNPTTAFPHVKPAH